MKFRPEFPILASSVYLVSNSLGAMPRAVYDRLRVYADIWASRGVRAWAEAWWDMPVSSGDVIAPLIGAQAGEITMHPNVTTIEAIVMSCFDWRGPRNRIVYTQHNFPSVRYVYQGLAAKLGAEITVVSCPDPVQVETEAVLAAIDERTCLVPISHVLFRSAYIQDAEAIIQRAHDAGAYVVLDAYHSVGIMPVDVKALDVDFLCGGVLKWLCGGPGGSFLYVKPELVKRLEPALTGWQAHCHPFAFEGEMDYREDAGRFLLGTPAIPALYAGMEGPKLIAQAGLIHIRAKSMHQTEQLIGLAEEAGFQVTAPRRADQRGGTIAINPGLGDAVGAAIAAELLRRDIVIDFRPGAGIRVSPHFYTKDEELAIVVREIQDIVATRTYEPHLNVKRVVT